MADTAMAGRNHPVRLVIFDCDGVLIDSERVTNRVVAAELSAIGWSMDRTTAQRLFLGMTLTDMLPMIASHIGYTPDPSWRDQLMDAIIGAMATEAALVDGAIEAIDGVAALGIPWRIASNSSHAELAVKFARTGLAARTQGRVHSHRDVGRGKPAPDLFLAAAAAEGVRPQHCIVIEDSVPGAMAARAAGMQCLGYAPHGDGALLRDQGAIVFSSMRDIPRLLALARQVAA
jgi:beta-phosphoglucomutase-like phosphatase (HAD superfamily)